MALTVTEAARRIRQELGFHGINKLRLSGQWYRQMAAEYGVSHRLVVERAKQARSYMRRRQVSLPVRKVDVATVARLYETDLLTVAALAEHFGVSHTIISAALFQAVDEGLLPRLRRNGSPVAWSEQQIGTLLATGRTATEIADLVGCHRTTVYRVKRTSAARKSRARKVA